MEGCKKGQKNVKNIILFRQISQCDTCFYIHFSRALKDIVFRSVALVTRQLHDSYTTVTRQLHDSYMTVTRQLHDSYMTVTRQLHDSYTTVTRQLHDSYTTVT